MFLIILQTKNIKNNKNIKSLFVKYKQKLREFDIEVRFNLFLYYFNKFANLIIRKYFRNDLKKTNFIFINTRIITN